MLEKVAEQLPNRSRWDLLMILSLRYESNFLFCLTLTEFVLFCFLFVQTDSDFLSAIHDAYLQSLSRDLVNMKL